MKKKIRFLLVTLLTVSAILPPSGCKKGEKSTRPVRNTSQTLNTNTYDLVVPTGTRVDSDEPDLPKSIAYWDPTRALKDEYTFQEVQKKYAIVVGHSTLIYTACKDLHLSHRMYCADYGENLFQNSNDVFFLGVDGKYIDSRITYADLKDLVYPSLDFFKENLGRLYVGNMGYYSPEDPDAPQITIVEETDDHVFATVKDYGDEGLFYASYVGGKLFYTMNKTGAELTDDDRQYFVHYSKLLFDHLSPDDGIEPYLYDKLVNTPILGDKYITSFDHITHSGGNSISLETKDDTPIDYFTLMIGVEDSDLKAENVTEWEEKDGIKMRETTDYPYCQEFLFTIDGIRYKALVQNHDQEKINADSLDEFLKLVKKCCNIE